jgi:hypothetical protein
MPNQNMLNMCECVCKCCGDRGPDGLCDHCEAAGPRHFVAHEVTVTPSPEYQRAIAEGNNRFAVACRHEQVFFGHCSFCGRRRRRCCRRCGMKVIKHDEWLAEAERRFGDPPNWKFVCPVCKTEQTPQDLIDAGVKKDQINQYIGFSCIGRFTGAGEHKRGAEPGKGCNWTLGGLLHIHTLEVEMDDGARRPVFEFAPEAEAMTGQEVYVQSS